MKKIGIITLYYKNYNYGGQLQAYALQKAIEKAGGQCEQVCVKYTGENTSKEKIGNYVKKHGVYLTCKAIWKKVLLWLPNKIFVKKNYERRLQRFQEFSDKIPHSEKVYTWNTVKQSEEYYNKYIVGSDQVWNPNYYSDANFLNINLLEFTHEKNQKMSYAASIGVSMLSPEIKKQFSTDLNEFDFISVRERTAKKILQPLVDKKIEVVLDPTFLLEKKEWEEVAIDYGKKGYILGYFLGESKKARKNIARIARKRNKMFALFTGLQPDFMVQDYIFHAIKEATAGPAEWLGMIKNADFVVTNSFHGTVFSLLFEKQFVVMITDKSEKNKTGNSRLYDVLQSFGLENRIIEDELTEEKLFTIKSIDYSQINKKIAQYRSRSLDFLNEFVIKN